MGTTAQKLEYLNTTKGYIKDSINLTNAGITNEPFRQYAVILKNRLPEIVGDPSIIWNNYEHVTGSGTSITISTYKSIFEYSLNGNTTQNGTPTPDAPIPVDVVTGNQTITISDGTNSTVQYINLGKNLFNSNNAPIINGYFDGNHTTLTSAGTNRTTYCKCEPNTTYTISRLRSSRGFIGTTQTTPDIGVSISNISTAGYGTYDGSTRVSGTITTGANDKYILLNYANTNTETGDIPTQVLNSIQIEKGSTATSYVPYFEPIELCKIGDYKDKIYKNNGKWYLHKEIGKVVLNGSENDWSKYVALDTTNYNCYYMPLTTLFIDSTGAKELCLSNYFTGVSFNNKGTDTANMWVNKFAKQLYLKIQNTITTITELKTWLNTHNTTVYYVRDTATTEEIKNYDLLNDLNSLELMTGSITITLSGDLASPIDITSIKN